MTEPVAKDNRLKNFGQLILVITVGVVSATLARHLGANFYIPFISACLAYLICRKMFAGLDVMLAATFALAHAIWFSVLIAIILIAGVLREQLLMLVFDVALLAFLLVWMWLRPKSVAVYLLLIFEVVGVILNISSAIENPAQFAIYMHIALRCAEAFSAASQRRFQFTLDAKCGNDANMLDLRPNCECCDRDLPPSSRDAMICTFECTFCADCASAKLGGLCPNCGGELVRRPVRPAEKLTKYPASGKRVLKAHAACAERANIGEIH